MQYLYIFAPIVTYLIMYVVAWRVMVARTLEDRIRHRDREIDEYSDRRRSYTDSERIDARLNGYFAGFVWFIYLPYVLIRKLVGSVGMKRFEVVPPSERARRQRVAEREQERIAEHQKATIDRLTRELGLIYAPEAAPDTDLEVE